MAASPTSPPSSPSRFAAAAGWLVVVAAVAFVAWMAAVRIGRVHHLTALEHWSVAAPAPDPESPTGYASGQRQLIVPGQHSASYAAIIETQQMLARGAWRTRAVDYENVPHGYPTFATAPYRWWLAGVAWGAHLFSGRSVAGTVEQAALYADPLLQVLLVIVLAGFAARRGGAVAAGVTAVAAIGLFPLAGNFQPGAPDYHSLAWLLAIASVLPLIASLLDDAESRTARRHRDRRAPIAAGLAGAAALWVDATTAVPVIAGIGTGAIAAAALQPRSGSISPGEITRWRAWSWSGAIATALAYAFEFAPDHLTWSVRAVHGLHALAWLGLGELIVCVTIGRQTGSAAWSVRGIAIASGAALAILALPAAMLLTVSGGLFARDPAAAEMANLPTAPIAPGFAAWLSRDGFNAATLALVLPLTPLVIPMVRLARGTLAPEERRALLVALAPALLACALGWFQLRWWNLVNALTLVVVVTMFASARRRQASTAPRWWLIPACGFLVAPALRLIVPGAGFRAGDPLSEVEVQSVLERDLAHWLAARNAGGENVVVFSTPAVTEALAYYGGIKGLSSYSPENDDGFTAAVRIASASNPPEALALIGSRGVTHFVLPKWDIVLEEYLRIGRRVPAGTPLPRDALLSNLARWELPAWVIPEAYPIPPDPGFANARVNVLKLQPEPSEALNACRLADYFLETQQLPQAKAALTQLKLYPRDPAALTMIAQVHLALGETAAYEQALADVLPYLSRRAMRTLPVDRRISLAALLANARHGDEAAEQVRQCLDGLDAAHVRELSPGALVRLVALANLYRAEFPDPELRQLALALTPPKLRARLETQP